MTNNTMNELQSVLERLSKKLDKEEDDDKKKDKKDKEDKESGFPFGGDDEAPPGDGGDDKPKKKTPPRDDEEEEDDEDLEEMNYGEDMTTNKADDMITTDYLTWLESTVKSAGFDPLAARDHFSKGYAPGQSGYDHRGQGSLEGAGEGESSKRPQANFGSAPSGNKNVIKGEYLNANNVSQSEVEAAYEVFKAAATEQQFKSDLNGHFTDRFLKEQKAEQNAIAKQEFDARAPMVELQKAVLALNDRIDNVSSTGGSMISKSASTANVTIPDTAEIGNMSWDSVHRLANKALNGGEY